VHRVGFHYKDYQDAPSAKHNKFISFDQVAFNVGMLFVYALGAMENYMVMNVTCLAIPFIFVLQFLWMPETPQYFLSKDNREGAAKSLQWLRGKTHDVQTELQELKVSDFQLHHDNLHLHPAVT
jgi:SP family facilitated glucose transporter-like MFS transporter 8